MENNNENLKNSNSENSSFFEQKVSSSNGNEDFIPKLRFKEFCKNWSCNNMGSLGTFTKGAPLSKADISETGFPFILYGELYTTYKEVTYHVYRQTDANAPKECFSNIGDVIIPTSGETPEEIATATCVMVPNVILGGDLNIYRNNAVDGRIISYIINHKINKCIAKVAQGKSVVHIKADDLSKMNIKYPEKDEQAKIINFLWLIDKRIEKQRQLVESLKKYKRGLLFRIFKIDNKTWSSSNLGDLCDITTGKLDANAMCSNGIYRFYTCAKEFYYINDYAFDTDALLISGNGANVGYIHHYNGKFNAYQRTYVLDNFKQNIIYIKYYLETFLRQRIESEKKAGNTPYIVLSTLSNFKIKYPAINEQDLIAKFLSEIDTVIEKQEILLDQILTTKQGLLQQMFI